MRVKNEDGGAGPSVKRERGGYASSDDDDEDPEFPRKNIDFIELSSDENEPEPAPKAHAHLPIRIGRKPHKTKEFGINTDASTDVSAGAAQPAEAPGASAAGATHKGKGKAKEVEITGESKKYKGMWQDSDSGGDVGVKAEPISSEDEAAQQVGIDNATVKAEGSPERARKVKFASKVMPSFQTDEERQEWERIQYNLIGMRKELGPPEEEIQTIDASGDITMIDAVANASKPSVRDEHTYLFQLPPIMPELLEPGHRKIKEEPSEPGPAPVAAPAAAAPAAAAPANGQPAVKKEEEFTDPLGDKGTGARFASGRVGKMRVYKSGRTVLDWGGISYEVGPGNPTSFLQEVVSLDMIPEDKRVVPEDAGEALSFGRIKEKFVVTPNFSHLLG